MKPKSYLCTKYVEFELDIVRLRGGWDLLAPLQVQIDTLAVDINYHLHAQGCSLGQYHPSTFLSPSVSVQAIGFNG